MTSGDALIPPFRYALIEKDLYRGAYPRETNLRFLKRLRLRTIVSLLPKAPSEAIVQFCAEQRITLQHFTVPKFKEGETPLGAAEAQTLVELLIEPRNLPLYVHCLDGVHNTGMLIMLLRKLQCWTLAAVMAEFTRFVRGGSITTGEAQFVERFRGIGAGVQLPHTLPNWLWEGKSHLAKHPTILVQPHPDTLLEFSRRQSSHSLARLLGSTAHAPRARGSLSAPRRASRSDSESDNDELVDRDSDSPIAPVGNSSASPLDSAPLAAAAPAGAEADVEAVAVSRGFVALDLSLSENAQLVRRRRPPP
jgi:tyrosine-protein phosphatase OCA6